MKLLALRDSGPECFQMSHSLNSLNGVIYGIILGRISGAYEGGYSGSHVSRQSMPMHGGTIILTLGDVPAIP